MWCHSDIALELHRARAAEATSRSRRRKGQPAVRVSSPAVVRPVPMVSAR